MIHRVLETEYAAVSVYDLVRHAAVDGVDGLTWEDGNAIRVVAGLVDELVRFPAFLCDLFFRCRSSCQLNHLKVLCFAVRSATASKAETQHWLVCVLLSDVAFSQRSGFTITGGLADPGCQGPGPGVSRRLKGSHQIAHRGHTGFLSVLLEDSALLSGQGRHEQAVTYSVLDRLAVLRNRLRSRCAGRGALLFEPVLDRLGHYHGLGGVVVDAVLGDALLQGFRDEERDLDFQLGLGMVLFV